MTRERFQVGDLEIDVGAALVTRRSKRLDLPRLSFDLLVALIRQAPDVVGSDHLIAEVWDGAVVSDETLTQRVALVRRALNDNAHDPRYIRSVRGRGYQVVPPVVRLRVSTVPFASRHHWAILAVILSIALGASILGRWRVRDGPTEPRIGTTLPTAAELVLRADAYLQREKPADTDLAIELFERALAVEPGHVDAILGLSFAISQRVTKFNLGRAESDRAVALARQVLDSKPNHAPAHHALALAFDSQGRISQALSAYKRVAGLDPKRHRATASAAYLLQVRGQLATSLEANLKVAGTTLVGPYLEVQIATTLAALDFDAAAEVWFEKALQLRPDNVFAHLTFAEFRFRQGRWQNAAALAHEGLARGIRRAELEIILGNVALIQGNAAEAQQHYREALLMRPQSTQAAVRLLILEQEDPTKGDAASFSERYRSLLGTLERQRSAGDEWPDPAIDKMLLNAAFNDPKAALAALDVAIALGYRNASHLLLDPMLGSIRELPEFGQRIEGIRLLVAEERDKVLTADWLPASLLDASAGRT